MKYSDKQRIKKYMKTQSNCMNTSQKMRFKKKSCWKMFLCNGSLQHPCTILANMFITSPMNINKLIVKFHG